MRGISLAALAMWIVAATCNASSVTVAGLLDGEDGRSIDLDGSLSLTDSWTIAAGAGRGESRLDGERFEASSLRAGTDVLLGRFFAGAGVERWKDSGQLRSTILRGELGWLDDSGFAASLLVVDRSLDISYTATILGVTRGFDVSLDGTGLGADLSWFGAAWSAGARFLDYDYGRNVDRARAIRQAAATQRFPRLQRLLASVATRAASAPDRELGLHVSRQHARGYVAADWQLQRDAITGEENHSGGLTVGMHLGPRFVLDAMAGLSDGGSAGSVPWGGLALTFRSAPAR